ncbi:Syntaxin UFE1 [Nakaseomyces bracarensis]|uniref:Syntaxin UFE1 n=1 Tax=Nakaseomyces bracarensis TaxID=273131 RepID=A0ABR4P088_9SACH
MSNITPLFKQYVNIIADEVTVPTKDEVRSGIEDIILKDTFMKECRGLAKFLFELDAVLKGIGAEYMNDYSMTESEKDDFDTEARLQIQEYIKRFKHLEKYEQQRQTLIEEQIKSAHSSMSIFRSKSKSVSKKEFIAYHSFNNEFRQGVLRSLGLWIRYVSNEFSTMQQERLVSQRRFQQTLPDSQLLSQNLKSDSQLDMTDSINITVSQSQPVEHIQEEVKLYEETMAKLTQEQLQVLETEHEELINQKNEQLKTVEQINKSILEIVSIQSELATHLQVQSQNINSMLDNQDIIESNIMKGNKELNKAQRAAGRTAKFTTYMAIIIAILILLLDYIN